MRRLDPLLVDVSQVLRDNLPSGTGLASIEFSFALSNAKENSPPPLG